MFWLLFCPGCFKLCGSQGWGVRIFIHCGFVPLPARSTIAQLSDDRVFSLRNLHPVLLMSVSSFHFLPHCTSILFCAAPSPSAIVCNHSVMGILLIGNTLLLICNSLVRSNMVCVSWEPFFVYEGVMKIHLLKLASGKSALL